MDHVNDSSKQKRGRLSWKKEGLEKTFLEACIHEINQNGREGGSLKMQSWRNVGEKHKKEHNFIADQRQMKNHYDYLKGKYSVWRKLRNKTGNVYNPITNTINLSEEEWQIEIKSNKHAEPLRNAPLLFPDLCMQLFDGSTSNGFDSWESSSRIPHPEEDHVDPFLNENANDHPRSTQESLVSTEECPPRFQTQSKRRKGQTSNPNIMAVAEDISNIAKMMMEKNKGDDMGACLEKLEKLEWGTQDPIYQTAILLFGESADFRRLWLLLKPETCENWVRNAGRKFGLLG